MYYPCTKPELYLEANWHKNMEILQPDDQPLLIKNKWEDYQGENISLFISIVYQLDLKFLKRTFKVVLQY